MVLAAAADSFRMFSGGAVSAVDKASDRDRCLAAVESSKGCGERPFLLDMFELQTVSRMIIF